MDAKSKNGLRASYLARVVARRDGATLRELVSSLRQMDFDDASAIIELAEAQLLSVDLVWWNGFVDATIAYIDGEGGLVEGKRDAQTGEPEHLTSAGDRILKLEWSELEDGSAWTSFTIAKNEGVAVVLKQSEGFSVAAIIEITRESSMAGAKSYLKGWLERICSANLRERPIQ